MKDELKLLYKKDPDLAQEAAKVLGFKIEAKKKKKCNAKPKPVSDPKKEYESRKKDIISYIVNLNKHLKAHTKKFEQDPKNWALVGDLGYVKEHLSEILDVLAG